MLGNVTISYECRPSAIMICSPKTGPTEVRLLWDNHILTGGLFHEEFTLLGRAGGLCDVKRVPLSCLLSVSGRGGQVAVH